MKSNKIAPKIRKWSRFIHRDLSYFIAGVVLIYAISGIAMNHRSSFNPDYSVERMTIQIAEQMPPKSEINKAYVLDLLENLDEQDNYTKHYFPTEGSMKVFLKGGSSLVVDLNCGKAVYEKLTRRYILSSMTRLHYNPGQWWTYFADFFAISLILLTVTGIIMVKGNKGLWGRGGIELLAGIAIPLIFLFM